MQVQYVTNEQGKQVGVLLTMADYQQLVAEKQVDPEVITGLSREELEALAHTQLASDMQSQLDDLLQRQKRSDLTPAEVEQLDKLLAKIDQLTILKTRARYTLHRLQ